MSFNICVDSRFPEPEENFILVDDEYRRDRAKRGAEGISVAACRRDMNISGNGTVLRHNSGKRKHRRSNSQEESLRFRYRARLCVKQFYYADRTLLFFYPDIHKETKP